MIDPVLNPLFAMMVESCATDLHWCEGSSPTLRVNGCLRGVETPPELDKLPFDVLTTKLIGERGMERLRACREYDGAEIMVICIHGEFLSFG